VRQRTTIEQLQKEEGERGHINHMRGHDGQAPSLACRGSALPLRILRTRVGRLRASQKKFWGLYGPKCGRAIRSRTQPRATAAAVASSPSQRICSIGFGSKSRRDSPAAQATLARNQRESARWQTGGGRRRTSCSLRRYAQSSDSRAFRCKIRRIHRRTSSCRRAGAVLRASRRSQNKLFALDRPKVTW
jgi:hypothetical protein